MENRSDYYYNKGKEAFLTHKSLDWSNNIFDLTKEQREEIFEKDETNSLCEKLLDGYYDAKKEYIKPTAIKVIENYRKFKEKNKTTITTDGGRERFCFVTEIDGIDYEYYEDDF